jgi:hypothetical protein
LHALLAEAGLGDTYEAAHARLALDSLAAAHTRLSRLNEGRLKPLASAVSQAAADESYLDTARKLTEGLSRVLAGYDQASDPRKRQLARLWQRSATAAE